jgi:dTDP-4-dehydrorhamnose reductase
MEGQIARSLGEAAALKPDIVFGCSRRAERRLATPGSDRKSASHVLTRHRDKSSRIYCYTAVDRAKCEPALAFAMERESSRAPLRGLASRYYIYRRATSSTAKKQSPYIETDTVGPETVYGRSKLEGEHAVAAANQRHIIPRTAWVYSPFGNNIARTMHRRLHLTTLPKRSTAPMVACQSWSRIAQTIMGPINFPKSLFR